MSPLHHRIPPPPGCPPVTDVQLLIADRGRLRAFATLVLDGCFVVRGIKIIQGPDRLFIAMPSRRGRDGAYQDLAHPTSRTYRQYLEKVVLAAYRESGAPEAAADSPRP